MLRAVARESNNAAILLSGGVPDCRGESPVAREAMYILFGDGELHASISGIVVDEERLFGDVKSTSFRRIAYGLGRGESDPALLPVIVGNRDGVGIIAGVDHTP